jgi:hypothetical protein
VKEVERGGDQRERGREREKEKDKRKLERVRTEGIRKGKEERDGVGEVECLSGGEKKRVKKDRRVEFGLLGAPCRDSLILVRPGNLTSALLFD